MVVRNRSKCIYITSGQYYYKNYRLVNYGYYPPDKCVWWEAINLTTNEADFHAHTKRELLNMIDEEY